MEREDEERRLRREMRRIKRKKEERIRQLILAGFFTAASVIILAAVIVLFKNVFQKKQVDPGEVQVPEYVQVDSQSVFQAPEAAGGGPGDRGPLCGKSMQHGQGKQELF